MKNLVLIYFTFAFILLNAGNAFSQEEDLNNIKTCLQMSNVNELANYFDGMIEVGLNGKKQTYSKSQATFILRDFFDKEPASEFTYVHKGESKGGLVYSIGKYQTSTSSYRVLIRMKDSGESIKIYNINFSKD